MTTSTRALLLSRAADARSGREWHDRNLSHALAVGNHVWAQNLQRSLANCDAEIAECESALAKLDDGSQPGAQTDNIMLDAMTKSFNREKGRQARNAAVAGDPAIAALWSDAFARAQDRSRLDSASQPGAQDDIAELWDNAFARALDHGS